MKITKQEVLHVAKLARLHIDEASMDKLSDHMEKVLKYVDKLSQVNTQGVKPTSHAIFLSNAFREDGEPEHIDRDAALANAPEKEDGCFIVPKVVG